MKDGLYTRHEVACIIADLFGGTCACDYSGNDEWLPQYCEFADNVCPYTVGVACWEQYLEHMDRKAGERKMTEKQRELIEDMNEFCTEKCPLDADVQTASDYISRNIEEFKLLTMDNWQLSYL